MKDSVLVRSFEGGGGTGWITTVKSGRTVVITNDHVCRVAVDGMIIVNYRGEDYLVSVIKSYAKHDLCAIEAPPGAKGGYSIASSFDNGEVVYTLGHPYLEPNSITKGELSGVSVTEIPVAYNVSLQECSGETYKYIGPEQMSPMMALFGISSVCLRVLEAQASTVSILPGNSGSCTVNIYGNVVGVAYAGNEAGTRSYHVPLKDLKAFLSEIE